MASIRLPSKIAAIGISKTGDLDVIENLVLPFPSPTPSQFIIKVEYAGVNFVDIQQRKGSFPLPHLPAALGVEAAGTIVALPTDETVLNSDAFRKHGFKVGGKVACIGLGAATFAEYTLADWLAVTPLPPTVSTRVGAASLAQGLTALTFASEAYDVRAGDRVLVQTVAGGLGLWFAQLCKQRGAVVIGTTSTAEKAAVARAHGADHVILYRDEDVAARVLEITNGEGVHAIFDGVGKDTYASILVGATRADPGASYCFEQVRDELEGDPGQGHDCRDGLRVRKDRGVQPGRLVRKERQVRAPQVSDTRFCPKSPREWHSFYTPACIRQSATLYVQQPENGRDYGQELVGFLESGAVKPVISKEYPFTAEGVAQSQTDMAEGRSVGKLLIKVTSD
ncbi:NAD-P-binding protein [Ganoderma leucocontextum]|nr:NAD-P-binding protein [Ganoderma leucocontextum]